MSKRARYDGPHDAVEIWPFGYTGQSIIVERGHLLPTETDGGEDILASFRDGLLEQSDIWSEVNQGAAPSKKKDEEG